MVAIVPFPQRAAPRELREYLAGHDAPCPGCARNLRGLLVDRCPECARLLSLAEIASPPAPSPAPSPTPVRAERRPVWMILILVAAVNGVGSAFRNSGGSPAKPTVAWERRESATPAYRAAPFSGAPVTNRWSLPGRAASPFGPASGDNDGRAPTGWWSPSPPGAPAPWNSGVPGGPGLWASPGSGWPGRFGPGTDGAGARR